MSHYFEVKNMYPVNTTTALARATEALHPYWSERYPSGSQAGDMAKDAVSAALHDPDDPDALAKVLAAFDSIAWSNMRRETKDIYRRMADAVRAAILGEAR